jgi:hypothetical protein
VIQIWLVGEGIKLSATALVIPAMATKLGETKKKHTRITHTHLVIPYHYYILYPKNNPTSPSPFCSLAKRNNNGTMWIK